MDFASRAPIAAPAVARNPRARGGEGSDDAARGEDANGNEDETREAREADARPPDGRPHDGRPPDGRAPEEAPDGRAPDGRAPEEAASARSRARPRARRDNCRAHEDDAMCAEGARTRVSPIGGRIRTKHHHTPRKPSLPSTITRRE